MPRIEIDPAFASSEYPRLIEGAGKSLQSLQIQLDETEALLASDLAKEDEIVRVTAEAAVESLARNIRVQQYQLAGYEARLTALKKAANKKA